ncbi:hypothetical protein MLD38_030951 [Melastoma candidum]|uniref:Uncharacterized protein n=1 Tax=Melastoma candidum TaxID=119954 RepID=A0ACB9MN92_9MYRT|nr:hypothetical protein MLD38_030951 [Melastoma candidum]
MHHIVGNMHEELPFLAEKEVQKLNVLEVPEPNIPLVDPDSDIFSPPSTDDDSWDDERNVGYSPPSPGDDLSRSDH